MKEPYHLALWFAAGFVLTAGISLWRSGDFGEALARAPPPPRVTAGSANSFESAPPPAATSQWSRAVVTPTQSAATPRVEAAPEIQPAAQDLTPETAQQQEQQARRLARRAAERAGH